MKLLAACCCPAAVFIAVVAAWLYFWRRGPLLAERWPWLAGGERGCGEGGKE